MSWFQKSNYKETLDRCNFHLAAREIARVLHVGNEEAKAKGGYYAYKEEFAKGWENFAADPCYATAEQFLKGAPEYKSFILNLFAGCCPGGIFYRSGIRPSAAEFRLGDCRLDMRLQDIQGLREFTKEEYAIFGRESLQETIYHANPTEFIGRTWETMVGTMEGKIYQLGASLAFNANNAQKEMTELIRGVYEHCEMFLGVPTEERRGFIIWDTDTGKVIFQYAVLKETDTFAANLFIGDRGDKRYGNS
jgi:hypothetical protein